MNEGWLELESDPGLFTLLVQEFGVKGVQVEEIYDLQKPLDGIVYGFIFLFKWIEERRARRKVTVDDEACVRDEGILKEMFFAHQVVPDSCATHALLSILLNCPSDVQLGKTLAEFKDFTRNFSPESKGYAIGNMPEIAKVHNSHAHPEPPRLPEKQSSGLTKTTSGDTFHFVSYVPIKDRLFELDGLKPFPIDHGPWGEKEDWTEKFRRVIAERLENEGGESDIRFNLMAVVSDRLSSFEQKLNTLRTNRQIIHQAIQRLIREEQQKIEDIRKKELLKQGIHEDVKPAIDDDKKEDAGFTMETKETSNSDENKPVAPVQSPPKEQPPEMVDEVKVEESSDSHHHRHHHKRKKRKKKHHSKSKKKMEVIPISNRLPPALDNHNYAKSLPSADDASSASTESETEGDVVSNSDASKQADTSSTSSESQVPDPLKREILDSDAPKREPSPASPSQQESMKKETKFMPPCASSDVAKPLTIQTLFDKSVPPSSPFSNYSTDSASEVGSAFNSPIRSSNHSRASSPNSLKVTKFQQWKASSYTEERKKLEEVIEMLEKDKERIQRIENEEANLEMRKRRLDSGGKELRSGLVTSPTVKSAALKKQEEASSVASKSLDASSELDGTSPFTPRELLDLMKSVEDEIQQYEQKIQDEKEKRTKYKIDDCRRTHNYDPFLFTFLSMLAEQGKLNSLIEKHSQIKSRKGLSRGKLTRRKSTSKRKQRPSGDKMKKKSGKNR